MKPFLITICFLFSAFLSSAQGGDPSTVTRLPPLPYPPAFTSKTKLLSFGLGFPNIRRLRYPEPSGYSHLKTTGFGPVYVKFEKAITPNVGILASYGYGTFHYSYFHWNYFPGYKQQIIYYDEAYNMAIGLSANYHFTQWLHNPRLDLYAGAGFCLDYAHYQYGNIPPYREPETKTGVSPILRAGGRYYADRSVGLFAEAGYDGLSVLQLGLTVRF